MKSLTEHNYPCLSYNIMYQNPAENAAQTSHICWTENIQQSFTEKELWFISNQEKSSCIKSQTWAT